MRLFLKSLAQFLFVFVILNYPVAYFIKNHYHTENKQNWVLSKNGLSFDYAVLGASRVFNMIDIKSLDSTYNKKGINIGTSGSCYAENYLILSEFTAKNTISTLVLNIDEFSFCSSKSFTYPFHEFEYLPQFNKYDYIYADFMPKWKYYLWKIIPIAKYFEFNDQYTLRNTHSSKMDKTKGTELLATTKKKGLPFKFNTRHEELDEIDKKYFLKIIDLCETKKIKIIFITTPIYGRIAPSSSISFLNYIKTNEQLNKVPYYNYNQLFDYLNRDYFNDNTHTNTKGSIEYSINLGKKLKEDKQ
jgi:hypothetical protein